MENRNRPGITLFLPSMWSMLKDTYSEWRKANAQVLGAALAFYTIFSLAPIFIIVVAIAGFFVGQESVRSYIVEQLSQFVGPDNAASVMHVIKNSYEFGSGARATIIAVSIILVASTTALVMLKNALDTIWDVKTGSFSFMHMIKDRLLSLLIILFMSLIIFVSMILNSILSAARLILGNYISLPYGFITFTNELFLIVMLTLLFAMLFKILPDVEISWKDVWMGGVITAILFALGKYLLGLYLARSTVSSAYGAAGSLVVFLMWVYYSSLILFFGAAFTQVYARRSGAAIIPKGTHINET
ncbi:MAG: YihY/virulence factor BrkB family protein [Thermodesulfobacteriota bacterium]